MVAKRPSYIRRADSLLRLHILPALGSAKVEAITPDQVRAWWQALPLGEHRRTCDLAYGVLRSILNTAVEDGLIETSPCHVSKAGRPSEERKVRALDYGQVEAIADHMPERWRLAVLLAGWLGLRDGEIRELRRKDIDLKAKTITISRQVTRGPGGPVVTDPKTEAGIRTVAMPAPLVDEVRQHLRDYAQIGPEGLLFYAVRSGQHAPDSPWRRALAAACEAAGLPPTSWHPLRHTALTRLALAGATKRELMATAGHRDGRAADRYQALAADHAAEVLDRVSDAIEAARKKPA
ncbi:MAG: site-specific integrase [Propionibacteriaceae bacterium]|nr:site-specific integrase [Propionibacteriaceae bacterium]